MIKILLLYAAWAFVMDQLFELCELKCEYNDKPVSRLQLAAAWPLSVILIVWALSNKKK